MSENKDILLKMLADEPKLYDILKSKEHLLVLETLEKEDLNYQTLKTRLGKDIYIKKDIILYNILDTLISGGLIKKIKVNENIVYYLSEKGRNFVRIYMDTKKEFNI